MSKFSRQPWKKFKIENWKSKKIPHASVPLLQRSTRKDCNKFVSNFSQLLSRFEKYTIPRHICSNCILTVSFDEHLKLVGILLIHYQTHSLERPFKCLDCSKIVSENNILKPHPCLYLYISKYCVADQMYKSQKQIEDTLCERRMKFKKRNELLEENLPLSAQETSFRSSRDQATHVTWSSSSILWWS